MLKIVCKGKGGNKESSLEATAVIKMRNNGGLTKEITVVVFSFSAWNRTSHPIQFTKRNAPKCTSQWTFDHMLHISTNNKKK